MAGRGLLTLPCCSLTPVAVHDHGDQLAAGAAKLGVNLIPGSKFFAGGGSFPDNAGPVRNHVRLSYSYATPEQIDEGVARLDKVYQSLSSR